MCEINKNCHYVYLLRPKKSLENNELVYKIGKSKQQNTKRINSYPRGSELKLQTSCEDCDIAEKIIIKKFKEIFKWRKDYGNEYFEGNHVEMIDIINKIVKEQKKDIDTTFNCQNEFPDFKNDKSFGGIKKYIKIEQSKSQSLRTPYTVKYINENNKEVIYEHQISDELMYLKSLIGKNIISLNEIYDIRSASFIAKINDEKIRLSLENFEQFENFYNVTKNNQLILSEHNINETIRKLFNCNLIINNKIHCIFVEYGNIQEKFEKLENFDSFALNIGISKKEYVSIIKINNKYYDYRSCLRKYIPTKIICDKNRNFYLVNQNGNLVGQEIAYLHQYAETYELLPEFKAEMIRSVFDGTSPFSFINKKNYMEINKNYTYFLHAKSLKKCLNENDITTQILSYTAN